MPCVLDSRVFLRFRLCYKTACVDVHVCVQKTAATVEFTQYQVSLRLSLLLQPRPRWCPCTTHCGIMNSICRHQTVFSQLPCRSLLFWLVCCWCCWLQLLWPVFTGIAEECSLTLMQSWRLISLWNGHRWRQHLVARRPSYVGQPAVKCTCLERVTSFLENLETKNCQRIYRGKGEVRKMSRRLVVYGKLHKLTLTSLAKQ